MTHRRVRMMLYDYIRGEVTDSALAEFEKHLAVCAECRKELEGMKSFLARIPDSTTQPSDGRTPQFWESFVDRIEAEVSSPPQRVDRPARDVFRSFFVFQRSRLIFAAVLSAVVIASFGVWRLRPREAQPDTAGVPAETNATLNAADEQVEQYFRKSRILLVGLMNAKEGEPVDLSLEQRVSRELVRETRLLKRQPLTPHAARIVRELEPFLIGLSNLKTQGSRQGVDLLRDGVEQGNLLFKVRMAENVQRGEESFQPIQ